MQKQNAWVKALQTVVARKFKKMIKTFIPLTWLLPIVNLKTWRRYQKRINLHPPLSHGHFSNFAGGLEFFCLAREVLGFFSPHQKGTEAVFTKQAIKENTVARYQSFFSPSHISLKQEQVPDPKAKKLHCKHRQGKKSFRSKTHLCITMKVLIMYSSSFFVFCSSSARMSLIVHCSR